MKYEIISTQAKNKSIEELVFLNRGIPLTLINNFKNPKETDLLDFKLLKNIEVAAKLLLDHIDQDSKIFIQVDSDCDGYTSSAILLNWIHRYNKDCNIDFRLHDGKEHGIDEQLAKQIIEEKYDLVIVPDAGSNQFKTHLMFLEASIDCIVLDHHECNELSSYAIVVNPQIDDYPNKNLSGAGVVYKFCKALDSYSKNNFSEDFLDLVSLGMIADMVDTRDLETRYIFKQGLSKIKNNFLKALIEKQSYSMRSQVTPTTIGFYIAPLINATVRAGEPDEKITIFKALLEKYNDIKIVSTKRGSNNSQEFLTVEAVRIIFNIKSRQNKMRDSAFEKIENKIIKEKLNDNKIIPMIIDSEENIDKKIAGLIANKIMTKYQKPVLILRRTSNGSIEGSGRGYDKSEFVDFKDFLNKSNLVDYAEGHANAFGVKLQENNLGQLIEYSNRELASFDFSKRFFVDKVISIDSLSQDDVYTIASLKSFWGRGFEEPLFAFENIKFKKDAISLLSPDKSPTLKMQYKNISLIKFGSCDSEYKTLTSDALIFLNIVGRLSVNEWQGEISPQILIEDYQVVSTQKYFF